MKKSPQMLVRPRIRLRTDTQRRVAALRARVAETEQRLAEAVEADDEAQEALAQHLSRGNGPAPAIPASEAPAIRTELGTLRRALELAIEAEREAAASIDEGALAETGLSARAAVKQLREATAAFAGAVHDLEVAQQQLARAGCKQAIDWPSFKSVVAEAQLLADAKSMNTGRWAESAGEGE